MKERIRVYIKGRLRLRVTGAAPERFFNLCRTNRIPLWGLCCQESGYECYIHLRDLYRIRPYARKAQVRVRIIGRNGLPFFLHRNRRRKWYAAGVLAFFVVLAVMSQFIWAVSVEGNYSISDDTLIHYLDEENIRYGMWKGQIDCNRLEEQLRSHFDEIIWVSARISGTQLMIRVKENDGVPVAERQEELPRDLVADVAGTITGLIVRQGKPQVEIGAQVEPGQVLVSGLIPILDDAGQTVKENQVYADADIYARTGENYAEPVAKTQKVRIYSGRTRLGLLLRIGGLDFLWMPPRKEGELWQMTVQEHQLCLLEDFYLPVWCGRIQAREYGIYEEFLTKDQLEAKKERIHQQKLQNFTEKGVQIIENNVKIQDKGSFYEVQGQLVLNRQIGIGQNISETRGEETAE